MVAVYLNASMPGQSIRSNRGLCVGWIEMSGCFILCHIAFQKCIVVVPGCTCSISLI